MVPELSLVIPTYNEKDNIRPLLSEVERALHGIEWEIIFVDDNSPDGTSQVIEQFSKNNGRIRCLQRIGRRGLSSACIEGMLTSKATYLAVMDADLQHDTSLLSAMLECLKHKGIDLVLGSRYVQGGDYGQLSAPRVKMSKFATFLSRLIVSEDLKDPMSGFFMIKRSFFNQIAPKLSGKGYKILLDIFASCPQTIRFQELPFQFRKRVSGESKLNLIVLYEYMTMILKKLTNRSDRKLELKQAGI